MWEHKWIRSVRNCIFNAFGCKSKYFFWRQNSVPNPEDGVLSDVCYHLSCSTRTKKEAQRTDSVVTDNEEKTA